MTQVEREEREYKSLFTDERFAKKAWKEFMGESLAGDAKPLPVTTDPKTGEQTFQSQLDQMAYNNVKKRLEANGKKREPMQAEIIVECNILKSRFSDSAFNTIMDRTAGKVKDEINLASNPFEDLTDEELAVLAAHRKKKSEENTDK